MFVIIAGFGLPERKGIADKKLTRAQKILREFRKADSKIVLVASHRGDWRNFPENSLEAITSAIAIGVDIVEIDIQQTRDGELVLMHDKTVDRTTTGKGKVAEMTLKEIQDLRLKNGIGRATNYRVPTLAEALHITRDRVLVNLDKCYEFRETAIPVIRSLNMYDQVILKGSADAGQVQNDLGKQMDSLIYMPVLNLDKPTAAMLLEGYLSRLQPATIEMVFSSDTSRILSSLQTVKDRRCRVWVNALWDELCAGHSDDKAVLSPDQHYGWLLARGMTIIQTDRAGLLLHYLQKRKLRPQW